MNAVQDNNTLAELIIPNFSKDAKKRISSIQEVIVRTEKARVVKQN